MIIDAHLHCSGRETVGDVLRALDEAKVDVAVLLAPFLNEPYALSNPQALREANEHLSKLVQGHGDRLIGFAVVNPLFRAAADDLEHAVEKLGLRGLKLVPSGWYPYDECAHRVYSRAARLGVPILFHSGIYIDGRSGRFCRPAFFEAVREHRGLRVALAHMGWPWSDEANALGLVDLMNGIEPDKSTFRFDISFGPPPIYRQEVLRRALSVLGPSLLQFGSDRFLPCSGRHIESTLAMARRLMDELGVSATDQQRVVAKTAAAWLGISDVARDRPQEEVQDVRGGVG